MGLRTPKESNAEPEFHLTDYTKREDTVSDHQERLDSFPDLREEQNETEHEGGEKHVLPKFENRFEVWNKTRDDHRVSKE